MEVRDDYQKFSISENGVSEIKGRMLDKLESIPLPELEGKSVLDVGCDMGFWSFLCSQKGASVLGLDRSRSVKGEHVDLVALNNSTAKKYGLNCKFEPLDLGKQWHTFGRFDQVLMFSLYHHVFENAGDHHPIWFWLWLHGPVLWENPLDSRDRVVQMNVSQEYSQKAILDAAASFFEWKYVGPAKHEPHRFVFDFTPKPLRKATYLGRRMHGAGGASKAWQYAGDRRTREFFNATGDWVHQGSINLRVNKPFDYDFAYFRFPMMDVVDRRAGLDGGWDYRWARAYPVKANGRDAFVFRFEGESYPEDFVEIVSKHWIVDQAIEIEGYGRS